MAEKELNPLLPQKTMKPRSLLALWAVLLVCAAPIVAAVVVYFFLKPSGNTTNFGQLVIPQRPAVALNGKTLEGKPFEFSQLSGQWSMVIATGSSCDKTCQMQLYNMRQIRISTGKNRDRVERIWLVTDNAPIDIPLLKQHEGLTVVRVDPARLNTWLSARTEDLSGRMWFVDPRGNLMMQYSPGADAKGIRQDFSKLLYINKI